MQMTISDKNVYVISDIHNDADGFKKLLQLIHFKSEDVLIIAGDIFDRGEKPVELYFEILKHDNIYVIQGNHDVWVRREIRDKFSNERVGEYLSYNTVDIIEKRLTQIDMLNLASWIESKPYYIELVLDKQNYQICHAQTYKTPNRLIDKSKLYMGDLHYTDFLSGKEVNMDFISVVGHTPTDDGKIWVSETGQTIRVDCGDGYKCYNCNGALGAIRLNDHKEFYIPIK